MKKEYKATIIIAVILVATMGILAVILPYLKDYIPQTPKVVRIYVNSTIHDSIYFELTQYKQDLTNQGYNADIIVWSGSDVSLLKQNISNAYYQDNLTGVIFIGDLPYALARHYDGIWGKYWYYPCDLYLMDLDGQWLDIIPNGIYDIDQNEHTAGSGDWTPEIWLARITPSTIQVPGYNYTEAYKKYFERNNKFRHGLTDYPHKALLYIDDDWSNYKDEWISNFTAYSGSELDCYWNNPTTNSTNYMNNLTTINYEFVHLLAHSWPTQHLFGPPWNLGSEGSVWYYDVFGNNTLPLFYNLYACFSCNFTQVNNIGTYYLFNNNTLTVIGSARDGGMDLYQPFYDALKDGKVIGEAFRIWFHNPEIVLYNKQLLYYGMTILGDPLLTII